MYRKILVPLDGGEASEGALGYAHDLARRCEGSVELVLVPGQRPLAECEAYLEKMSQSLAGAARWRVQVGPDVTETLLLRARVEEVDLMVMTTHGRDDLTRATLGSVAEHVVRRAHCPVLVIPPRALSRHDPNFRRILVTLDGSRLSEWALEEAIRLARLYSARLTLLRVATEPDPVVFPESEEGIQRTRAYLERVAAGSGIDCDIRFPVSLLPQDVIARAGEEHDLIVMASHGRGGLVRALLGSVCEKVLRHAPCPALVLNRQVLQARHQSSQP